MSQILPAKSDELTPEILNPLLAKSPHFTGAEIIGVSLGAYANCDRLELRRSDSEVSLLIAAST